MVPGDILAFESLANISYYIHRILYIRHRSHQRMIINETRDSSDNSALDLQYSNSPKLQNAGTSYLSVLYLLVSLKAL